MATISSRVLPKGTVLLSSRAPVGYIALAGVPTAINQGFIAMVCDGQLSNHYVLNWTEHNLDTIKNRANGSTFQEISKRNFRPIPVVVPTDAVIEAFGAAIAPVYDLLESNLLENRVLAETRDVLLPELLSGRVRVPNVKLAMT